MVNIGGEIKSQLPDELVQLITEAGEVAARRGERLYLVGGTVRDLFLKRPTLDLDLVLEGSAPSMARELGKLRAGEVTTHPRFGTATFRQGAVSLDLVTARSETYAEPGALPTVKPGSIRDDLSRRDFSINAMAVCLAPVRFGELVDPHGGRSDLERGLIRVLHEKSFRDDPTRVWRAVRYEQRLGFGLEPVTESLLRRDLGVMDRVSGDRLRHELEHILEEEAPERMLGRAAELGALQQLLPSLEGNGWLAKCFEQARNLCSDVKPDSILYMVLLCWRLSGEQVGAFVERLRFGGHAARALREIPGLKQAIVALSAQGLSPSDVCRVLDPYAPQTVLGAALAADSEPVRQWLDLYFHTLRSVVPALDGNDLKQMGVQPGRRLGRLLQALKDAKLDGRVATREDEQELVRQWLTEGKL